MKGHVGQILRLDLTNRKVSTLETTQYEEWIGGHGIGSAIFWDLVKNKAISGFDERNIITIMTSPLSGTLAPAASGRTEMQGIGVQSSPVEWFTRGNFGGRFGPMMKYAGWDGIVIEGKADSPVWVDIRNEKVEFKSAKELWGLDTMQTQLQIWDEVYSGGRFGRWMPVGETKAGHRTTQRPAVLTIGPSGERKSRVGCLIHDAGNAVGQGGFGGIWGSKNLKAISVIGTQSIPVADPNKLLEARRRALKKYGFHVDYKRGERDPHDFMFWDRPEQARIQSCTGCYEGCRNRYETGIGNESQCVETFYSFYNRAKHGGKTTQAAFKATDLLQKYGINAYEAWRGMEHLYKLYKMGVVGPGKDIDCELPFEKMGETEFIDKFLRLIAYREGIGDIYAEGSYRAAHTLGRLEKDLETGILAYPYWGLPEHGYDPRGEVSWGYASILGDRDANEHDFNFLFWEPSRAIWEGKPLPYEAEWVTRVIAEKLVPYEGDPLMLDYSTENIYSGHLAKLSAWFRHYTRFWKQSALYCDYRWPDFIRKGSPDGRGTTGEGEPEYLNAVTGMDFSFREGMELGRKIWNLDNAIWTLQGRHRDMVHFADYIYKQPFKPSWPSAWLPGRKDGKWDYVRVDGRHLDKNKFEEFKSRYYKLEGWDIKTGWPKKETLESLGLGHVADALADNAKLGSE
ncbi:aldehyde ferredoxin oxidoreductase N-terminal domain-containing protein [Acidobacteriota bacterium]